MHSEPDEGEKDALQESEIGTVDTPDDAGEDGETNVPFGSHIAVENGDEGNDYLADDAGDNGLPD